jgi:hypothetical protein
MEAPRVPRHRQSDQASASGEEDLVPVEWLSVAFLDDVRMAFKKGDHFLGGRNLFPLQHPAPGLVLHPAQQPHGPLQPVLERLGAKRHLQSLPHKPGQGGVAKASPGSGRHCSSVTALRRFWRPHPHHPFLDGLAMIGSSRSATAVLDQQPHPVLGTRLPTPGRSHFWAGGQTDSTATPVFDA